MSSSVPDLSQDAALAVESLILGLCLAGKTEERELKIALTSAVQLSRVAGPEISATIIDCLTRLLLQSSGSTLVLLCQALAAIGDTQPSAIVPALVDIMSMLKKLTVQSDQKLLAIPLLCVLAFSCSRRTPLIVGLNRPAKWSTKSSLGSTCGWLSESPALPQGIIPCFKCFQSSQ